MEWWARGPSKANPHLKRSRYLRLKDQQDWTPRQSIPFHELKQLNLKTHHAFRIKEARRAIFHTAPPAVERLRHSSAHRHPRAVARREKPPRLRSVQADHPATRSCAGRHHRAHRKGLGSLRVPRDRGATRSGLSGLRGRS
ncbi:transposase [Thioalkalicoccus limnaeus]|uniref:transposase n=1 Tax=Thioalkalicoccus limnaeus TaxID=120681 RepID=UPI0034E9749E